MKTSAGTKALFLLGISTGVSKSSPDSGDGCSLVMLSAYLSLFIMQIKSSGNT